MSTINYSQISQGIYYGCHPDHRNYTLGKSQWIISIPEELDCFSHSLSNNWLLDQSGWGLYWYNMILSYLGLSQNHTKQIFLAKFVDGNGNNYWHGYPADHMINKSDVPPAQIMCIWVDQGIITSAKMKKILRMQPCNL